MNNPFETIDARLSNIENILLGFKSTPQDKKNPPDPDDEILTAKQAAEFLSVTVPTIYSMMSNKELIFYKRRKLVYFFKMDLISFLREGRSKSNQEMESIASTYLQNKKKKGAKHG